MILRKQNSTTKAMTLVEVLLTLLIIGIIAALATAVLIKKDQILHPELLTANQLLTSAYEQVAQDNGYATPIISNDNLGNKLCSKLICTRICLSGKDAGLCGNDYTTTANPTFNPLGVAARSGDWWTDQRGFFRAILKNGMNIAIGANPNCNDYQIRFNGTAVGCGLLIIDVNGANNDPNTWGKDIFFFEFLPDRIVPYGINGGGYVTDGSWNVCSTSIHNNWINGCGCTSKALAGENY